MMTCILSNKSLYICFMDGVGSSLLGTYFVGCGALLGTKLDALNLYAFKGRHPLMY